jgi:predicted RNA binding protein YcfA (HicA-like mRNA interferase family)
MSKFPAISGKRLIPVLSKLGFEVVQIKGSHHFLRHADGRSTVVPIHAGETIGSGLLSKILRDCEVTPDQVRAFL